MRLWITIAQDWMQDPRGQMGQDWLWSQRLWGDQIKKIDKILAKKKKMWKKPQNVKKINMVMGLGLKENPFANRGLCASPISGRFFPRLCTKPMKPKGPVMIFRRSWPDLLAKATRP